MANDIPSILHHVSPGTDDLERYSAFYRRGQHSIRVNDRWRICFVWHNASAWNVEIVNYH